MWTQCTICLSSHHTKRAREQPSILLIRFFLLSTPSPFFPVGWEEKLRSSQWAYCLPPLLPLVSSSFFCLPSFKTFKSPRVTSFPLSSLLFPFPASWPWLQLWKIEKFWLLCHPHSISFFPSFTAPFYVSIQTYFFSNLFLYSGFLHWSYTFWSNLYFMG